MKRLKPFLLAFAFIVADTLCVGAGMGVPIFAILFGFVVGWLIPQFVPALPWPGRTGLKAFFQAALLASGYTCVLMLIIWAPTLPMLWDAEADLANFGIPLILYTPRASFVGWEILMVVISPLMQLLAIIFAVYVRLMLRESRGQVA